MCTARPQQLNEAQSLAELKRSSSLSLAHLSVAQLSPGSSALEHRWWPYHATADHCCCRPGLTTVHAPTHSKGPDVLDCWGGGRRGSATEAHMQTQGMTTCKQRSDSLKATKTATHITYIDWLYYRQQASLHTSPPQWSPADKQRNPHPLSPTTSPHPQCAQGGLRQSAPRLPQPPTPPPRSTSMEWPTSTEATILARRVVQASYGSDCQSASRVPQLEPAL